MGGFRILVIKCGASGDVVRTTFILPGLKKKHKGCDIIWVTSKFNLDLIKHIDLIDEKIVFDADTKDKLNDEYEVVISLDDEKAMCELASSVKSRKIIGAYLDPDGKRKYTDDSEQWLGMGLLRPDEKGGKEKADKLKFENKKTYQQIISEILRIEMNKPIVRYSDSETEFARKFSEENDINKDDLVIGLNTGAGGRWKYKRISEEKTAELADRLVRGLGAKIILFGGPDEVERNKKIIELVNEQIIDAGCNNSLLEFAALIDLCDAVVASDTLGMHLGIAQDKKVVSFFGPTPAAEIEMYGKGEKIVPDKDCLVCYLMDCDEKIKCMELITSDLLFDAVKKVLGK
ncbi:MAG: glycosyltransferase family 9 protein [Candidatus Woesearchaeota archaeon]